MIENIDRSKKEEVKGPILAGFTCDLLNEDRCREFFLTWLFQDGVRCPECGEPLPIKRLARFFAGKISYCSRCHIKFFPLKGTAFHSTKLTYSELVLIAVLYALGVSAETIASTIGRRKGCVLEILGRFKAASDGNLAKA